MDRENNNLNNDSPAKKRSIKIFGAILSVVLLYFIVKSLLTNIDAVRGYINNIDYFYLSLSIISGIIYNTVTAYNWVGIQKNLGGKSSKLEYLRVSLLSFFLRYIPGGVWNILGKIAWCVKAGDSKQCSIASVVLEHLLQIVSAFFCGGLLISFFMLDNYVFLCAILIVGTVLSPLLISIVLNLFLKKKGEASLSLSISFLYRYFIRFVLTWLLAGVGLVIFVKSFNEITPVNTIRVALAYPLSWVAGFLSPTPNGLGVREMVLQWLLSAELGVALVSLIVLLARIWSIVSEFLSLVLFEGYLRIIRK